MMQQMPGQAPQGIAQVLPQMQGQQGAPQGVSNLIGPLSQLEIPQLLAEFNNPGSKVPKYAVLSAIEKKQQQQRAMQAVQGAVAQSQNAQMQGQGTVADQIMSQAQPPQQPQLPQQPVMAAHGGMMRGYAGGGAVAFTRGGEMSFETYRQQIAEYQDAVNQLRAATQSGDAASAALYARKVQSLRQQIEPKLMDIARYKSSAAEAPAYAARVLEQGIPAEAAPAASPQTGVNQPFPFGPPESPMMDVPEIQIAAPRPPGATRPGTGIAQGQQRTQAAPPAPAQTAAAPADLTPEMRQIYADREAEMRRRLTRPESLVAAEQGLAALAKSNIEAQRAEAQAYGADIRAARDAAMARAQRNIFEDPQALLALAGGMDTRRGRAIGSLAQGAAGIMSKNEAAAEAARKEFAQAQRDERAMQANLRQTQMLEAQRQVALEQGKLNEVNAINDKLAELGMEREKFRLTRGDKAFDQAIEGRKATATERTARAAEISAGKPSELDVALNRPDEYARVLKARAEATQSRVSPEERRAAVMERYADNWEKLDVLQKSELAKQGITNFQQYVRMRDQMAGSGAAASQMPTGSTTLPSGFKLDKP